MKQLFVDTSAWAAIADARDTHHQAALDFKAETVGQYELLVTNYILDEIYTLLLMNIGYHATITFKKQLDLLIQSSILNIVWVSADIANESWDIFEKFNADKTWSFTDCVSFTVMKRQDLAEVFAFDHHFVQMGFVCHPQ